MLWRRSCGTQGKCGVMEGLGDHTGTTLASTSKSGWVGMSSVFACHAVIPSFETQNVHITALNLVVVMISVSV